MSDQPKQENAYDCGMFVLAFASFISIGMGNEMNFSQDDIQKFRKRVAFEIRNVEKNPAVVDINADVPDNETEIGHTPAQ